MFCIMLWKDPSEKEKDEFFPSILNIPPTECRQREENSKLLFLMSNALPVQ